MCGIAGFIDNRLDREQANAQLRRMLARIAHRGPDDEGAWHEGPVAIGHRRLSIVDLSPLGHQPMASRSGRYVIAFNGEIYNHIALRQDLEALGEDFLSHSDTEVLMALIERCGLSGALERCVGMFAISLWDRTTRQLHLARDRFGEKPLYYGWHGGRFLWGSELRALCAHDAFERRIDQNSVALLLRYGYIPTPASMFENTLKLPAASILTLRLDRSAFDDAVPVFGDATLETYWSASGVLQEGQHAPFRGSMNDAADELEVLLSSAVSQQMQADVPLGAFLSGGIDSSLVVALMQRQADRPVSTFSVGFDVAQYNEAPYARAVATHLGTQHTEFMVTAAEAMQAISQATRILDEPLGDSSIVPTLIVAGMARQHVTVALTGDGGDEMFAGYPKYALARRLSTQRFPLRQLGKLGKLRKLGPLIAGRRFTQFGRLSLQLLGRRDYQANLQRKVQLLCVPSSAALVHRLRYQYSPPEGLHPALSRGVSTLPPGQPTDNLDVVRSAMLDDQTVYLCDDILRKSDIATMAVGLEARAPLLDHRVAEFAARLPTTYLLSKAGRGKIVLREVLRRHVPASLFERPKAGFTIPLTAWFRRELRSELASRVLDRRVTEAFHLDGKIMRRTLEEHVRGVNDWSQLLWTAWALHDWHDDLEARS